MTNNASLPDRYTALNQKYFFTEDICLRRQRFTKLSKIRLPNIQVILCYLALPCVMLCYVMLRYVTLRCVTLRYVVSCYVMSCHVMSCDVMLCYVMLCYVMLCYVMPKRYYRTKQSKDYKDGSGSFINLISWQVLQKLKLPF